MTNKVDNNGMGALYLTFHCGLDITTVDKGKAVCLVGNNEIALHGGRFIGRLEHVGDSHEYNGQCVVQVGGVARFKTLKGSPVHLGDELGVFQHEFHGADGKLIETSGKVGQCHTGRGIVIAVDEKNLTCDVLL